MGNQSGKWQDESQVREEAEREDSETESQNPEHIDNPEHMESPDSMQNPQSTTDVGRKVGEDAGSGNKDHGEREDSRKSSSRLENGPQGKSTDR